MQSEDVDAALGRAFEAKQMHWHACGGAEARITFASEGAFRAWLIAEMAERDRQLRAAVAAELKAEAARERAEGDRLDTNEDRAGRLMSIGHHARAGHLEYAAKIARGETR
jgi:hypothetical protein